MPSTPAPHRVASATYASPIHVIHPFHPYHHIRHPYRLDQRTRHLISTSRSPAEDRPKNFPPPSPSTLASTTMATQANPANVGLSMWKVLLTPNSASIHLLLFSTLFGSQLFHGFIGGPVTFQLVPRKTFGLMQSKIFPIYFGMGTVIPAALIGNLALAQGALSAVPTFPLAALGVTMVANAINWLYLGPKATNIMFERHELEKEEGIDAYKEKDKVSRILH